MTAPVLGRVVATERKPNTPHEFHFWTSIDSPIGIGTIVRVDGEVPIAGQLVRVYGVVVEGFSYTDLLSPIHDVLGHDGTPGGASVAATQRTEIRLYTAHVLRQMPEEPVIKSSLNRGVYLCQSRWPQLHRTRPASSRAHMPVGRISITA